MTTEIEKAELNSKMAEVLIKLSSDWENEDSCYGYRANGIGDIEGNDIFIIRKSGKAAGYLLCHKYKQEKLSPTVPMNSACLEVEELYIVPSERSKGLGKQLLEHAIAYYPDIYYVTLSTATKNYKAILHFYIDEIGFTFWNARLFKKVR